ncbi:MAG: hypothetical protein MRERV_1c034 [Mycoplasmataceae bacterium RV_VA103A]|nr:MAG: hypothetical protein MRERV_1c034 [Mycoplasmataceae bacterium RV_VA103A]
MYLASFFSAGHSYKNYKSRQMNLKVMKKFKSKIIL